MVAQSNEDFILTETLYRVLIPTTDNLYAETTSKVSCGDNGWERIRNSTLRRIMEYDSTVKLWSTTKRGHPLFQQLPHTIFYGKDSEHYFRLRRLNIPTDLKSARTEFKTLIKTGQSQAIKPFAENFISDWNFNLEMRRRLFKALMISSFVMPRSTINSRILQTMVDHSLKTELLHDIETNAYSMGLVSNSEDLRFSEVIRKFQEPSERFLPMAFLTTYKSSIYAIKSKYISPAKLWDSEPIQGMTSKDAAVEFNFIIRNLTTPWPRKYDSLHEFDHGMPIREVLPENMDLGKVMVRRSDSIWAKIARGEEQIPEEEEKKETEWAGTKIFKEKVMNTKGLKLRKNANKD